MAVRFLLLLTLLPSSVMTAVAQGTPAVPEMACAVAPRLVDDLIDLWFDSAGTPRVVEPSDTVVERALNPATGEPADAATIENIEAVAREWVACTNADDDLRRYSLFTDAYAQRRGPAGTSPEESRVALVAAPVPVLPEAALTIGSAQHARVFPDGTVGAAFATVGVREPGEALTVYLLFAQVEGQWRIEGMTGLLVPPQTAPVFGYRVLAEHPHDTGAYTQGLVLIDDQLYEGTGQWGESELRRVELESGEVLQSHALDEEYFGEGIVVFGDRIYQITWQSGVAFVYDRETFEPLESFTYAGEGWGLTTDSERLIMSDGSDRLVFRDPETFAEIGSIGVRDGGLPVTNLNELEYVDGEVWANVWQTDWIVRIDPATGEVTGWIDMSGLLPADHPEADVAEVLNGIAWELESGRLLVTGKYWPLLFEIELTAPAL